MTKKPAEGAASIHDLTNKKNVGRNLRITIAALGMKPADAAREMGITASKLGNWMRGDNYPDPLTITRFCADHGAPLETIYSGTAMYAHPSLSTAYAKARRKYEDGELGD